MPRPICHKRRHHRHKQALNHKKSSIFRSFLWQLVRMKLVKVYISVLGDRRRAAERGEVVWK